MDWISFTTSSAAELVLAQQRGEAMDSLIERHNRDFSRSYARWFEALYLDKYEYMGEYDLMRLAFLLDLGLYYLGVASQPFKRGPKALTEPVFSTPPSVPFFHFIRTYNRRFAQIARARRERQAGGRSNAGRRFMFGGYTFAAASASPVVKSIGSWAWLELKEGWRSWFSKRGSRRPAAEEMSRQMPVPPAASLGSAPGAQARPS
jgi:hypothetical protein